MSFQSYLDNIEAKTGKTPDDFAAYAQGKGYADGEGLSGTVKVGAIVADLKQTFGLGHGHAMAIVAYLKGKRGDSAA